MISSPPRITQPFLDVVEAFYLTEEPLHGYEIKRRTKRTGPTVYDNIDRLARHGWIAGSCDEPDTRPGLPPRRTYRLTPEGRQAARDLLVRCGRVGITTHKVREAET